MDGVDQVHLQGVDPGRVDRDVGVFVFGPHNAVFPIVEVAPEVDPEPEGERGTEDGDVVVEGLVKPLDAAQGQLVAVDAQDEREDLQLQGQRRSLLRDIFL